MLNQSVGNQSGVNHNQYKKTASFLAISGISMKYKGAVYLLLIEYCRYGICLWVDNNDTVLTNALRDKYQRILSFTATNSLSSDIVRDMIPMNDSNFSVVRKCHVQFEHGTEESADKYHSHVVYSNHFLPAFLESLVNNFLAHSSGMYSGDYGKIIDSLKAQYKTYSRPRGFIDQKIDRELVEILTSTAKIMSEKTPSQDLYSGMREYYKSRLNKSKQALSWEKQALHARKAVRKRKKLMTAGSVVLICSKSARNGSIAVIDSFNRVNERYTIKLCADDMGAGTSEIKINAKNLRSVLGARVKIHGLKTSSQYNGMIGKVTRVMPESGHCRVELSSLGSDGSSKVILVPVKNLRSVVGARVEIHGLKTSSQYNGMIGKVTRVMPKSGDYRVELSAGKVLAVSGERIRFVEAAKVKVGNFRDSHPSNPPIEESAAPDELKSPLSPQSMKASYGSLQNSFSGIFPVASSSSEEIGVTPSIGLLSEQRSLVNDAQKHCCCVIL